MLRYILRRLLSSVLVLFVIITGAFFVMKAAPGGPFDADRKLPPEVEKNIKAKYHLDKPVWQQYALQLESIVLHGDLGPSMKYPDRTVNEILAEGLPVSLLLGVQALFFALLIGLPAGLVAGLQQNTWLHYLPMTGAMAGYMFAVMPVTMSAVTAALASGAASMYAYDYILGPAAKADPTAR